MHRFDILHYIIVIPSTYFVQKEKVVISVKIMADVVESYLGALTLDQGLEEAEKFLQVHLFPKLSVNCTCHYFYLTLFF